MEKNNSKLGLIIGIVIVALVGLGIWVWSMNSNTDDSANQETGSQMTTDSEPAASDAAPTQDIVEIASATESLSTLVSAVKAAELVETLQGEGPFTVFAPTNAAFDKLPEGTLDTLLMPENKEQLASLLTYHVVAGSVMSGDITNGQVIVTVNGKPLKAELTDGKVYLVDEQGGRASVTTPDVKTSNGVVHIIDLVAMPSEL